MRIKNILPALLLVLSSTTVLSQTLINQGTYDSKSLVDTNSTTTSTSTINTNNVNSGTVTTSTGNHYVKVGSLVTCWMKLVNIQESGTQTADFAISGLPFAVEFDCVGGTVMANGFDFADDPDNVNNLTIWVKTDETLRIYETKDGNASWDAVTWGDISDYDDLYGQFTYRTTA
mgnify:CR=1 FL=1